MLPDNVMTFIPKRDHLLIVVNDYHANKLAFILLETVNNTCIEYQQVSYLERDPDDGAANTLWDLLGCRAPGGKKK